MQHFKKNAQYLDKRLIWHPHAVEESLPDFKQIYLTKTFESSTVNRWTEILRTSFIYKPKILMKCDHLFHKWQV